MDNVMTAGEGSGSVKSLKDLNWSRITGWLAPVSVTC